MKISFLVIETSETEGALEINKLLFSLLSLYIRYTSVIASHFLSQHPSRNHGLWAAKSVFTFFFIFFVLSNTAHGFENICDNF